MSSYSDIYSPETAGVAAAEQALTIRRQEHQQEIVTWQRQRAEEQRLLEAARQQIENQRTNVLQQQAENWIESDRIRSQQAAIQHEVAVVKREREALVKRDDELKKREDLRRRNRTTSTAFIEDSFALLSARSVLEHLTHSSPRVRKHAMDNVSSCISGFKDAPSTFVHFTVQDIALDILAKIHQLVSTSKKPTEAVMQFCEDVVSSPAVAKALALSGQCPRLADFLVENHEIVSQLAISSLRQMISMDVSVVKAAYDALALSIPHIPIPDSPEGPFHPAVKFIQEMTPKIIGDCFNNALWRAITPLVTHRIDSIRCIALRKIVLEAQHSDRTRHGLVEVHTLGLLDQVYQSPTPPPDVVGFFVDLLPLISDKMCRHLDNVLWMIRRISDPSPKIHSAVVDVLRNCALKQDPAVHGNFVKAELLRRLAEPPIPQSKAITKLICELLPILAIPHIRAKAGARIITYLDHPEDVISKACLTACMKIVDSTAEDRAHLYSVFSKLNFAKETSLQLCDYAMPAFCKDWAAAGDFTKLALVLQHPERRLRTPAHRVWHDVVSNTPAARQKIVHDDLVGVIFDLCGSQYDDAVVLGAKCCSPMAVEISKAGVSSTQRLVAFLNHPRPVLRQAALRGIQLISENSDAGCNVLISAGTFNALKLFLETHPTDLPENTHKLLVRLAPFLSTSSDACSGLLQLLESKAPPVEGAARAALASISFTNIQYRETLRKVILDRLLLASDILLEYSARAIQEWIGPDLAQLNDFATFFSLTSHSDKRIQSAALFSLKQKIQNREYQESLQRANVVYLIRSLSNSESPEAISFVGVALTFLGTTLARNGHVNVIIQLLTSDEPKISEGASSALEAIASGSPTERKSLLDEDIIERLVGNEERHDQTVLLLLNTIISKLVFDYLHAGKMDFILTLIDHKQQQIRVAAAKSVVRVAGGNADERTRLRDALLPRLINASDALREVAANCLTRVLARDLITDGDFIQIFRLFESDDPRIRAPLVAELQNHIQASDEAARRRLVDANILSSTIHAFNATKDDLVIFAVDCVLPILGPAISQNDGGMSIFPLLSHEEPRIRAAAAMSLRNAIDSRHGDVEKMTKAGIVTSLHPLIGMDDTVRDLWCYLLPKAAPFLSSRIEVDTLFESLSDRREVVREAASESFITMAKTSEVTREYLFPTLIHQLSLDEPPAFALDEIAQAVALSGSAFVSNGNEGELIYLIQHGQATLKVAAVEAITKLLSKGSSYEIQKLMEADIFSVAVRLHSNPSQRQLSLKLLYAIVSQLSHAIILSESLTRDLFSLFDDSDTRLSQTIYQSLANDPRVSGNTTLPELLPLLFIEERLSNPSVANLLRHLASTMVPRLLELRRIDIIVEALRVKEASIVECYLEETRITASHATGVEKEWFVSEPSFIPTLGNHLKSRNVMLRRVSSEIVEILSNESPTRSGRMMEEGIGSSLAYIAVNGEKRAQRASLHALCTLFLTAPDHADRLVADCLPALCDILENLHLPVEVYISALRLLNEIALQSSHFLIIECGIIPYLVDWSSPQYSITNNTCRDSVFQICQIIAQSSDPGRKALIDGGILPILSRLSTSHVANDVISACHILDALAHTGTYRREITSAGLKDAMQQITSPFRKSSLGSKSDKRIAQEAAKQVLQTLKSTKQLNSTSIGQPPVRTLQRSWSSLGAAPRRTSTLPVDELGTSRSNPRRTASEPITYTDHEDMVYIRTETQEPRTRIRRTVSESSEIGAAALRRHQVALSTVREDQNTEDHSSLSNSIAVREEPPTPARREVREAETTSGYDDELTGPERLRANPGRRLSVPAPPSYRTTPSVSGGRRQSYREEAQESRQDIFSEDGDTERRGTSVGQRSTVPPSYRTLPSNVGSIRRPREVGPTYSRHK